jgi:signal transduction histidine kinase
MAPQQREHAFDRFWRATASDHDGFGLGLAIVQRLVAATGGSVELRSAPGGGLDAVVLLPVAHVVRVDA